MIIKYLKLLPMRNLICLFLAAGSILAACKPTSYFSTPNDVLNANCTVYLTDGTQKDGALSIQLETGQSADNKIHLMRPGNVSEMIRIDSIKYFVHEGNSYYPKKIDLESYDIPVKDPLYLPDVRNILFLKRLTKEGSRLDLYELYKSRSNTSDGKDQYDYFVSFPFDHRLATWSIRGKQFFPAFDEKMSKLVSDCPSLADKIRHKEKKYYASQIAVDVQKYETIKKIVEEYNSCK